DSDVIPDEINQCAVATDRIHADHVRGYPSYLFRHLAFYHPPGVYYRLSALYRWHRRGSASTSLYLLACWPRCASSRYGIGYSTAYDGDHDFGSTPAPWFRDGHYRHCYFRGTSTWAHSWWRDC